VLSRATRVDGCAAETSLAVRARAVGASGQGDTAPTPGAHEHCDGRPGGFIVVEVAGSTTIWRGASFALLLHSVIGCTSIDPGPDFVIPPETFDPDYFYCDVEPQFIVAKKCGPGEPSDNGSCHYSSSVSGMSLLDHPTIDCGGGDHPLDATQTAGAAESNFEHVSFEMSRDYTTAQLFVRPSNGLNHPRVIFSPSDPLVNQLLSTWASK
jgi:hypothetical protein